MLLCFCLLCFSLFCKPLSFVTTNAVCVLASTLQGVTAHSMHALLFHTESWCQGWIVVHIIDPVAFACHIRQLICSALLGLLFHALWSTPSMHRLAINQHQLHCWLTCLHLAFWHSWLLYSCQGCWHSCQQCYRTLLSRWTHMSALWWYNKDVWIYMIITKCEHTNIYEMWIYEYIWIQQRCWILSWSAAGVKLGKHCVEHYHSSCVICGQTLVRHSPANGAVTDRCCTSSCTWEPLVLLCYNLLNGACWQCHETPDWDPKIRYMWLLCCCLFKHRATTGSTPLCSCSMFWPDVVKPMDDLQCSTL